MTGKASRAKGSRKEREVAKLLSESLGLDFQRTPRSGADARYPGDISADDFPYTVEIKSIKEFSWEALYDGSYALFNNWLTQSHAQSENPLLIFNIKYKGWFICQQLSGWRKISRYSGCLVYTVYNQHIIMALDEWINTYTRWSEYDNR